MHVKCAAGCPGNQNINRLAARVLTQLRPGDILLLHDCPPKGEDKAARWHRELDLLLARLARSPRVVPLAELLGRPVMERLDRPSVGLPQTIKDLP